jgi:hypothetical protein
VKRDTLDVTPTSQDFISALGYLRVYAKEHYRFTGGDVLEAWRLTQSEASQKNWKNVWASKVIKRGEHAGWFQKIGRKPTTSKQSHTASLALWQSKLFKPVGVAPEVSPVRHLDGIREKILTGRCSMREGLMEAYTFGMENNHA